MHTASNLAWTRNIMRYINSAVESLEKWFLKAADTWLSRRVAEFLKEVGFVQVALDKHCSSCICAKLAEEFKIICGWWWWSCCSVCVVLVREA